MKINKDNIHGNRSRVDHDYKVEYKVITNNHAEYKYETPYKGPSSITGCFTNVMVNLQYILIKIRHKIRQIKPYKPDTNVEDINPLNMCDDVNICY